jgi:hypothetical protein
MNKASLERELDSIESRAARIRTAQATACGSGPHRESRQVLGHEARRLLQLTKDLQRLQQARQDRMVNELFGLTVKLLNAH